MNTFLLYLVSRLKEPSTYAGLAFLLNAVGHANLDQPLQAIGMGLAGLVSALLPDPAHGLLGQGAAPPVSK
jgi:hypothetical protein